MKPLIGVIGNAFIVNDSYPVQGAGTSNLQAIAELTGATPVIVPSMGYAGELAIDLDTFAPHFAGFLFTGAFPNVHPEEYNETPTEAHGTFDRDRDRLALPLIRHCVARQIPILGICRGFQEFNVAFGGALYPEIRDLPGRMNHRMPPDGSLDEQFALRHLVQFEKGSVFTDIFKTDAIMVNSLHGQGVKTLGDCVCAEGFAPDGTQEALRIKNADFALAVQWHPEWQAADNPSSRALFSAFGAAVQNARSSAHTPH